MKMVHKLNVAVFQFNIKTFNEAKWLSSHSKHV